MTWPPVSSEESRDLRQAQAEESAALAAEHLAHLTRCVDGWLGEDADGRPIPCLPCHPALRPEGRL